jgi:prepilin-type N-terminal cleavage/methylation domain-containing protein
MKYHPQKKRGFTLIELVVTIVILGIVMGIGAEIIVNVLDSWNISTFRKHMLFDARMSVNRMTHELRQFNKKSLTLINPNCIEGYIYINPDTTQLLKFYFNGTNLMRDSNILASNVQSLHFTYWDANGTSTDDPPDPNNIVDPNHGLSRIRFRLGFQRGNQTLNYESGITMRN